uniref:Lectin n=1 Tax=Panagrolaimus sp. JU765 TaxID=591449 RepID=A0AC34QCR8_9BILA
MKLLVFVGLCTIFVIISGFEYGKDNVRDACWYHTFWGGTTGQNYHKHADGFYDYTNWVRYCPYENRITIHCKNGKVNPTAYLEIWDNDPGSDDFAGKATLTHIEPDGKSGYFDVYISSDNMYDLSETVDLYGKFYHPCTNVPGKVRVGNMFHKHADGFYDYTNWVRYCPYENRITIHCKNGKVNPTAYLEIWDNDPGSDDFAGKATLTHIEADGKSGYFDVYIPSDNMYDLSETVDLYGKFYHPCTNVPGQVRVGNMLLKEFSFD